FRGWDIWMQSDRVGTHIVSKWQEDALKVVAKNPLQPNKWTNICVTYDGSAKASGVKVYYDGEPQPTEVEADALKSTIRTSVPFKLGQRHTSERLQGVMLQELRFYGRALSAAETGQLAKAVRVAELLKQPKRSAAEETELFDWWLVTLDAPSKD